MPLQATSGAASYDAFGGGVAAVPNYIEECFSAFLYTGNGSTQTITNGIDLSGKGGLVWIKNRAVSNNAIFDTVRTRSKVIFTNTTAAEVTSGSTNDLTSFNNDGFSVGTTSNASVNTNAGIYASWTFRKQPKFFDVVTYTGNGTAGRQIAHGLGSTPGFLVVKRTDSTSNWSTWHTSIPNAYMSLDTTNPQNTDNGVLWGNGSTHIDPTSTVFTVSSNAQVNASGATYVAYLFAHNAGGFGLTGTDNVISCGSYVGNGSTPNNVTLGYEPQWIMIKDTTGSTNPWVVVDNMRGMSLTNRVELYPNNSNAELTSATNRLSPTATGFFLNGDNSFYNTNGSTYIYIAIRRGPMKVPTSGTSVFSPVARTGTSASANVTAGFAPDLLITDPRATGDRPRWWDRLRGANLQITSNNTNAENTATDAVNAFNNTTLTLGADVNNLVNQSGSTYINWIFRRAPSFFDEVCYTGTGSARTVAHNLGVAPELMIVKSRSNAFNWSVYNASIGATNYLYLNLTTASSAFSGFWNDTSPTASVFSVGGIDAVNGSGFTYVAYLFATCAGVSKVGSYTGNGSSQTINCGFTSGARFVLIKSTSAAGHWRVYDTARGIVAGNEPELFLNLTNAEQTVYDAIDTDSSGFIVNSNGANVNDSGVTYIFLAIA